MKIYQILRSFCARRHVDLDIKNTEIEKIVEHFPRNQMNKKILILVSYL